GATVYFGSEQSSRQLVEIAQVFHEAHSLGMATVLWCYLRNPAFTKDGVNYEVAADLTGQANHLGVTIEADIIKQKLPENNGGFNALKFGRTSKLVYEQLTTDNPIDRTRYQVANCYMGRAGLINSGGASAGETDLKEAVKTAVINKRAGGMGLISGRKAFQRPMADGIRLLNAIQDVYLNPDITIAEGSQPCCTSRKRKSNSLSRCRKLSISSSPLSATRLLAAPGQILVIDFACLGQLST